MWPYPFLLLAETSSWVLYHLALSHHFLPSPQSSSHQSFYVFGPLCVWPFMGIICFRSVIADKEWWPLAPEDRRPKEEECISAAQKSTCLYLCFKSYPSFIYNLNLYMFQHWMGQGKTFPVASFLFITLLALLMFLSPASAQWEDLRVEGARLNAGFIILSSFDSPHLIVFCYCRTGVQLKHSPNCLRCSSQSEACKEYFKQLSCGLFLKCHVTPKVILCYLDYS